MPTEIYDCQKNDYANLYIDDVCLCLFAHMLM